MTRSWEKSVKELHVFSRYQYHVYNSQMGIQIWFHIWKWRICCFSTHNSTSFKFEPRICQEVEKKGFKNYTSSLAIKTTCTTPKWVSKYDFIFANEEFVSFQPKILLHSNLSLEYEPKLGKSRPRTARLRSQSRSCLQLSNGYPNMISYLKTENLMLFNT